MRSSSLERFGSEMVRAGVKAFVFSTKVVIARDVSARVVGERVMRKIVISEIPIDTRVIAIKRYSSQKVSWF